MTEDHTFSVATYAYDEKGRRIETVRRWGNLYDSHGNWTERIVSQRIEADADERPSNIERRTITY